MLAVGRAMRQGFFGMLYFCETGNFGDDLNPWLWRRLVPEVLQEREDRLFLGIGTILDPKIPAEPQKFVFGSGWSGGKAPAIDGRWTILGVRGPLTAQGLGLGADVVLSDPALLVRRCFAFDPPTRKAVGFMPHHRSVSAIDWKRLCRKSGLFFIDPERPVETVLREISSCRLLLSEAMHGAILADAFRIPWIPLRIYSHINEFKWRDWCGSMGLEYRPARLPPVFDSPPRPARRVAHLWKRTLAPTPLGKHKWRRLPLRRSRPAEIREFSQDLAALASSRPGELSSDEATRKAEDRQLAALARLRAAWA